jgi:hypothetical protein
MAADGGFMFLDDELVGVPSCIVSIQTWLAHLNHVGQHVM